MAKKHSKNTNTTLQESVERLVSEDIKKEMTIGNLKDRLKEAVGGGKVPGIAVTDKVLKQSGKDNKASVDAIMKKIKDYLSIKDNSNPEFPHQNNSKTDYDSPMYRNNTEQEDYVDEWRGGGMEDLQYNTEPSDEFKERFGQYLDGSIETGNNDGKGSDGQQVANVVPSKLGEKIKKTMKKKHKDLKGAAGDAIPNDWPHHRNPGYMGESTQLNEVQGINAERIAKELYDAMDGMGTKEDEFFAAIQPVGRKGLTPEEQKQVKQAYKNLYDEDLCDRLPGDFGGDELKKALTALGCGLNETISKENITESISHDMEDMKHLFNYNKITQ